MKQKFATIVNKFRTKKWPWVISGIFLVVVIAGSFGSGSNNPDRAIERANAATQRAEAKASKEAAKKEEKERIEREEKQQQEQAEAKEREEKENRRRQEEEKSSIPGPNAKTEELRLKWFWDRWSNRMEVPNFASWCDLERADGLYSSWTCRAERLGSLSEGGFEIYTDAVKGKRKTFERADADKLANQVIRGICTTMSDESKDLDDVFIEVRDYTGSNIERRTCVNYGVGY